MTLLGRIETLGLLNRVRRFYVCVNEWVPKNNLFISMLGLFGRKGQSDQRGLLVRNERCLGACKTITDTFFFFFFFYPPADGEK